MNLCVGLTGGIGCGKSTVSKLFAERGAGIIDTDVVAHQLTHSTGDAIPAIREAFGSDFVGSDGALNRDKMRTLIFSDAIAKQRLESILHPLIFTQAKSELQPLQNKPYVIITVPLLFTSPTFQQLVQRTLVVDCSENQQVSRVMARSQMTESEVHKIIAQQTPRSVRLQLADDVIANDSSIDNLTAQVDFLHKFYTSSQNNN
ncbi:MAG: dephospho-CoA kinase [Gallionella sp.]|nr:dephospho-CoA kinase [Gallionella sp.]